MGKVYLTGAGPGDLDLITVKALKIIRQADAIIYDRLINDEILQEAKRDAKLIYVGKQHGHHSVPQEEINDILHQTALLYEHVVRLKGGDNFVFGRGGEEALYLVEKGIDFEIIPGISSSIAVPAYAGIPVTHRGVTTSFRVVTGHETSDKVSSQIPWDSFNTDETLIFLMGFHNLQNIVHNLLRVGKSKQCPCALISKGTTDNQTVVVGTLDTIIELGQDLVTPVLIIVGEVVKLREKLRWYEGEIT